MLACLVYISNFILLLSFTEPETVSSKYSFLFQGSRHDYILSLTKSFTNVFSNGLAIYKGCSLFINGLIMRFFKTMHAIQMATQINFTTDRVCLSTTEPAPSATGIENGSILRSPAIDEFLQTLLDGSAPPETPGTTPVSDDQLFTVESNEI